MNMADPQAGMTNDDKISLSEELVRRCERSEPDPGSRPGLIPLTASQFEAAVDEILLKLGRHQLWVFAYGSLIWKPVFEPEEVRHGTLQGWRRSFCLEIHRWRGSPEHPGLMLGLKREGSCTGILQRAGCKDKRDILLRLLRRETTGPNGLKCLHIAPVETAKGSILALVFWAEPDSSDGFTEHDQDTTAKILARACGHVGSCAAYLRETVLALRNHGIHDGYMWDMQERVATAIQGK